MTEELQNLCNILTHFRDKTTFVWWASFGTSKKSQQSKMPLEYIPINTFPSCEKVAEIH